MGAYHYGGFWRRCVALIIDLAIISVVMFITGYIALEFGLAASYSFSADHFQTSYVITSFFINIFYFSYFIGVAGQTPGKRALGLKVIREDGNEMTLGVGFLRCVGYLISMFFFYLGFIWVAFDRRKQGWHDKIAGTLVISAKDA
ncbi:MAG: RDD family protein [Smithellaceae bacterium]|nr:RDD family protein [Smithellaceae bacterium]